MARGGLYRRMVELQSESAQWRLNQSVIPDKKTTPTAGDPSGAPGCRQAVFFAFKRYKNRGNIVCKQA